MALPWSEVETSKNFQAMPEIEKAQAQQDYFNQVVASQVPSADLEQARKEFIQAYPRVSRQRGRATAEAPKAHYITDVSRALGVDPKEVDVETGGKFLDRLDYSFSDTDEEVANKFGQKYPEGTMARIAMPQGDSRLVYKENDQDQWKTVEDYGVSPSDIADVGGEATMLGASIAAGMATGGSSVAVQMLAYGGGYAGGYLAKEAVEGLRGTQLESGMEVLKGAGVKAAEGAIGAGVGIGVAKLGTTIGRRGIAGGGEEVSQLLTDVRKAQESGMGVEDLMIHQQAPERMILGRFGAQAESTAARAQKKISTQRASVKPSLEQMKGNEYTDFYAGEKILSESKKIYKAEYNKLINELGRKTPRKAEASLKTAVEDFIGNTKSEVNELYKTVDNFAEMERPIFNLAPVSEKVQQIKTAVMGVGKETAASVQVADTPVGQLSGIIGDIEKLSNVQVNYEVIKQLRTRAGELIEKFPWDANFNKGQAKRLYGVLSEVLEKPVNPARNFVGAHKAASAKAKARYDVMDQASIQSIIKTENTGTLIKTLSEPNKLTPDIMKVLQSRYVKPNDINGFKTGVLDQIVLNESGSIQAIKNYRTLDPEGWRFMVPKKQESRIMDIAENIDKLNRSNLGELAKSNTKALDAVDRLLFKKGTSRSDINAIADAYSADGMKAIRHASYEDILNKTVIDLKGVQTIDKKKLGTIIKEYKKSGIWDRMLTKQDRTNIQGLKSYLDLIFWRGSDPGVSLEAAQAITDLKHPVTFFNGIHKLSVNSGIAWLMMSKTGSKLMLGSTKAKIKQEPLIVTEAIIKGMLEGTEPGAGTRALEQELYPQ